MGKLSEKEAHQLWLDAVAFANASIDAAKAGELLVLPLSEEEQAKQHARLQHQVYTRDVLRTRIRNHT